MAALTASRDTPTRAIRKKVSLLLKANAQVYRGGLVAVDATGYAVDATTATGYQLVLIAAADATGTAANGGASVDCYVCEAYLGNLGGDAVVQASVGTSCFVTDDQTVSKTNGSATKSAAGTVMAVDSGGVWVSLGGGI